MAQEERTILEDIASDMGANRVSEMTDAELVEYITEEEHTMTDRQIMNRAMKREALLQEVAKLNAQIDALELEIKGALGEKEHWDKDGWKISFAWRKGAERFNKAAFGKAHPDLLKEYTVFGNPTRPFHIAPPKITA